jgi:phosphate transport system substrate-binding protein
MKGIDVSERPFSARSTARRADLPAALALACLVLATGLSDAEDIGAQDIRLIETGSSLLYPLFNVWASQYMRTHPGIRIETSSTGSATGMAQAISGTAQIGTSDAYMSDAEARQNPNILNIPMAISALTVNYNLPDLGAAVLRLDGPVLAGIYAGKIRSWDDRAIAALNPGVALPHHDIIPVRRSGGSGDTFVFSQYLSFTTPWWEEMFDYAMKIDWPAVPGALSARGNSGMLKTLQSTPYAIGYAGVSFHAEIDKAAIGTAMVKSYSGEFLLPTAETITAAAASLTPRTPADERLTLVNAPGAHCYPLINYEYAIVSKKQPNPETAKAIRKFLLWAIAPDETNAQYLEDAHFIPLPAHIWVLSHDQIEQIN